MKHTRPEDLFRAEKERALTVRNSQHARLLAEAKAAFDKLMAEGQAARKSGRPRKHPLPPLKTSSVRTPIKPAAPVPPVKTAAPAAPATPAPVVKPAKPQRPEPRVIARTAASGPRNATAARPASAKKAVKAAKPKPKAKSAKRR
jgi:hypothetical protein